LTQISTTERLRSQAVRLRRDGLVRTSLPLVVNTGVNGFLGIAYWVVAARAYDQEAVGTNTALIALMTTLSGFAQLNLGPSISVLVPRAGEHGRRVVLRIYAVVTVYSLAILSVFLTFVLPHLSGLSDILGTTNRMLLFALAVLAFNMFALQDAVLASTGWGVAVPIENAVFGILKIGLLVLLAASLPEVGIFGSWLIPLLLIVPVVSCFIFRNQGRRPRTQATAPLRGESSRKLALDYFGYLFQASSTLLLPVLALGLLGPVRASVFAVAWLVSSTMDLLANNVGTALTVETSYGGDPAALRRTLLRSVVPFVGVVVLLGLVSAPLILKLYGSGYAAQGVLTLQILLLASVPRAVVTFAIAESRAHRRIGIIVWLRAQNAALTIGLCLLLTPRLGVEGMAIAWLVAQVAGAAAALLLVWRKTVTAIGATS
jgi:O-antigen/teichoic acid export membrane protein